MRLSIKIGLLLAILLPLLLNNLSQAFAGNAILTWDANTQGNIGGYKVYYGTAPGVYSTTVDVSTQTTYTITALGIGTYYFATTAYDSSGNESAFSSEVSKTFGDTIPPALSAIAATNVTAIGVTITWTANEPSDAQVQYGLTSAYSLSTSLSGSMVTAHSQNLIGLSPSTTYHFRVLSKDAAGNLGSSGDNTFTTIVAPDTTSPSISSIASNGIGTTFATIIWTTNEPSDTQVEYGSSTAYGSVTNINTAMVTNHSQGVTGLAAAATYHFRVLSKDAAGNPALSGDNTFTTVAAPDTVPPVISGILSSNVTVNSAVITWTTNELASSQVQYGPTSAYGSLSALNTALSSSHSINLTGLSSGSTYHYRVISKDAAGNTGTSGDNIFAPPVGPDITAPIISKLVSGSVTSNSAIVTWTTNEASTSQVQYGITTAYGTSSPLNTTLMAGHSITLTGLNSGATYHYRVISKDAAANTATSGDGTFTTSSALDINPPVISEVIATNIASNSATITWNTNEASTSQVEYGPTTVYGSFSTADANLVNSHSITLLNLAPGVIYQYRVNSKDSIGNNGASPNNTFTTMTSPVLPDTTPPADISNFKGARVSLPVTTAQKVGVDSITLSWINPSDADFVGVRILYNLDHYPTDINDGILLGDFSGKPNEDMSAVQSDLQVGSTYYYSASAYDNHGNYQQLAHTLVKPLDTGSTSNLGGTTSSDTPSSAPAGSGGGCSMLSPDDIEPSGPWQAADMSILCGLVLIALTRKMISGARLVRNR